MTREQRSIVDAWAYVIAWAMELHDADAAYRLTVAAVRRCRELGLWD
jgi:hypothetical protein